MTRGEPVADWLQRTTQEQAALRAAIKALLLDRKARSIATDDESSDRVIEAINYAATSMDAKIKIKYSKKNQKVYFFTE